MSEVVSNPAGPAVRPASADGDAWPDVTIGIVAAKPVEGAAMRTLMANPRVARFSGDPNEYRVGHLESAEQGRPHRIVLVTMAEDNTRNAASTCTDMLRSFPRIRCVVMAGIAGGVPAPDQPERHVRLGDVVVAVDGIVDYGHLRRGAGGGEPRRPIGGISMDLKRAAQHLEQGQMLGEELSWSRLLAPVGGQPMANFARPSDAEDRLHRGRRSIPHPDPVLSGHPPGYPKLHFGAVGCADVLLMDADVRDRLAARHQIIAFEMEAAGIAAGVASRGLSWFVVRGIVDYCDDFKNDRWHAYASLAAAGCVRAVLAECPPFPVWRVASTGVRTLLPEWEMDRLHGLLAQVPDVDGRVVWPLVMGDLVPLPDTPSTLAELTIILAEQNARPDLIPPLMAFVEQVAARAPARLAAELRAWSDRVAEPILHLGDRMRAYRQHLEESRPAEAESVAHASPIRPCLLIQIERDGIDSERCEVRYWIQRRAHSWQPEPSDPRQTTFRRIERIMQAAIQHAETAWRDAGDGEPVEIELLLPGDLLHTAVEWWQTELEAPDPTPLCLDYPVVVRSLDRMRAPYRHRVWNQRWRSLWKDPPRHRVYWGRAEPGSDGLSPWNARLRENRDVTTVVLGSSPERESGGHELESALNAGIPVIVWDRRAEPLTPAMVGMLSELTRGEPTELVDRVRKLRVAAAQLPESDKRLHPGRHVALLWDDPDRNVYDVGAPL
jgi:nucleoside phosphorylase